MLLSHLSLLAMLPSVAGFISSTFFFFLDGGSMAICDILAVHPDSEDKLLEPVLGKARASPRNSADFRLIWFAAFWKFCRVLKVSESIQWDVCIFRSRFFFWSQLILVLSWARLGRPQKSLLRLMILEFLDFLHEGQGGAEGKEGERKRRDRERKGEKGK